jgi:hypothetical protein
LQGDGKYPCYIVVSYANEFNDFNSHQALINKDIKAGLAENAYKIKFLCEELNFIVNEIKVIIKNCTIINKQIEKNAYLQNTLMENLTLKEKQVCAVKTRTGTETQDPDYPEGHRKRIEQDTFRASKNLAGESPNDITGEKEEEENEESLSDAETQDENNDSQSTTHEAPGILEY